MDTTFIDRVKTIIDSYPDNNLLAYHKLRKLIIESDPRNIVFNKTIHVYDALVNTIQTFGSNLITDEQIITGFEIDQHSPFLKKEIITIGGRPGTGKTALIYNLALNISKTRKTALYSFYESDFNLGIKLLSLKEEMNYLDIREKFLSSKDFYDDLKEMANSLNDHNLLLTSCSGKSTHAWLEHCQNLIKKDKPEVIIIDYIQLMGAMNNYNVRDLEIGYILRNLKELALEHNLCIIVSSELNRNVENRTGYKYPFLSDLRDSGSIESMSDKVILTYRPEHYQIDSFPDGSDSKNRIELIFAKDNKFGLKSYKLFYNTSNDTISDCNFDDDFEFIVPESRKPEIEF